MLLSTGAPQGSVGGDLLAGREAREIAEAFGGLDFQGRGQLRQLRHGQRRGETGRRGSRRGRGGERNMIWGRREIPVAGRDSEGAGHVDGEIRGKRRRNMCWSCCEK